MRTEHKLFKTGYHMRLNVTTKVQIFVVSYTCASIYPAQIIIKSSIANSALILQNILTFHRLQFQNTSMKKIRNFYSSQLNIRWFITMLKIYIKNIITLSKNWKDAFIMLVDQCLVFNLKKAPACLQTLRT